MAPLLSTLLLASLAAVSGVIASPIIDDATSANFTTSFDKRSLGDSTGTNNGYFYSIYSETSVTGSYTNGAGGSYIFPTHPELQKLIF
jgi:endo-1,4-beta-xylanase